MTRRLTVEADGGSRGNPGPAGCGAVVTDTTTGEVLAEEREFLGVTTNNAAEYRGLIAGVRAAHRIDPAADVLVRMDSRLVVEQMSGRWKLKHPALRPLAAEAAAVFPPEQVRYEWIPRERNVRADRLANEAMDEGGMDEGAMDEGASAAGRAARAARFAGAADEKPGPGGTFVLLRHGETALTPERRFSGSGGARGLAGAVGGGGASGSQGVPGSAGAAGGAGASGPAGTFGGRGVPGSAGASGSRGASGPAGVSGGGGLVDPPLSEAGRRQAHRAAEALAACGTIQAVVASPLARCRETASVAADRLGLPVEIEPGLREADFGAWEGLNFAEVRERHPADLDAWLASPEARPTGGGESLAVVTARITALRAELTLRHPDRTVLLVTHLTPIKALVAEALGAPPQAAFRMDLSAASLSAIGVRPDGTTFLRLYNETAHLRS